MTPRDAECGLCAATLLEIVEHLRGIALKHHEPIRFLLALAEALAAQIIQDASEGLRLLSPILEEAEYQRLFEVESQMVGTHDRVLYLLGSMLAALAFATRKERVERREPITVQ
jgi:hypothetical protein